MLDDRRTQLDFDGSITLSFAEQVIFDYAEYFSHVNELMAQNPVYSSARLARTEIFYESFFVSVFSYLEAMTGQACDDLATILHQKIRLKDINERSKFEGTRKYLALLANAEFPSENMPGKLAVYRKARNAIVHGNGLFGLKEKEVKTVEHLPGIRRDEDGFLELTPKFCEGFIEFCRTYVVELKSIAHEIAHRGKSKALIVT
jgi:uncharacterized protein YbaA (DUF1428 family)